MGLETSVLERVEDWESLSQWEKAELGRALRRLGLSYGEIMELVPVKKSTLATWCRDIGLSDSQAAAIKERRAQIPGIPRDTQWRRRREIELIKAQAMLEAEHLVQDPFWVAGVSMYWGEGSKATRRLSMANADPAVLRMFRRWSTTYLPPHAGWRARLNVHADNDEKSARLWWSKELDLPIGDFTKSFVKPDGTGHRKNHLEHGVCTLTKRKSTNAFVTTLAWIEFLQDTYGRYDYPRAAGAIGSAVDS